MLVFCCIYMIPPDMSNANKYFMKFIDIVYKEKLR